MHDKLFFQMMASTSLSYTFNVIITHWMLFKILFFLVLPFCSLCVLRHKVIKYIKSLCSDVCVSTHFIISMSKQIWNGRCIWYVSAHPRWLPKKQSPDNWLWVNDYRIYSKRLFCLWSFVLLYTHLKCSINFSFFFFIERIAFSSRIKLNSFFFLMVHFFSIK